MLRYARSAGAARHPADGALTSRSAGARRRLLMITIDDDTPLYVPPWRMLLLSCAVLLLSFTCDTSRYRRSLLCARHAAFVLRVQERGSERGARRYEMRRAIRERCWLLRR